MSRGQSGAMTRYFDHHRIFAAVAIGLLILALPAAPAQAAGEGGFTVARVSVSDDKSVFASVRSADTVPARARIAGTIVELKVDEGSAVSAGAVVALVADEKLALRAEAIDAQIAAATSEVENARAERERASALFERGTISKARMDQLDTALSVAENRLRAAQADFRRRKAEGKRRYHGSLSIDARACRRGDRLMDRLLVGHVGLDEGATDLADQLDSLLLVQVRDHHLVAGLGQSPCGRLAQSGGTAKDDRTFSLHLSCSSLSLP